VEDKAAAQTLAQALENLNPERVKWTEATLWQKVAWEDFGFEAEGRYLSGPDHRLHLDLKVLLGRTHGKLQVISDGTTLWEIMQVDGRERTVTRAELSRLFESRSKTTGSSQLWAELCQEVCVCGLFPLLNSARRQMTVTHQEMVSWNTHDAIRLTLVWNAHNAEVLAPPDRPWPAYLPRHCFLYLDAETYWPYRLEWWGPGRVPGRDTQVYQIEFRDLVLNQALSPERCVKEFSFGPGQEEVQDRTEALSEAVEARVQELSGEKKPPGRTTFLPK
jgi:hypothetical protein